MMDSLKNSMNASGGTSIRDQRVCPQTVTFDYKHFTQQKTITQATKLIIMYWQALVKYRLSITANLLPMYLYILAVHNFHILISIDNLPIATNVFYLLVMFCQCFATVK